MAENSDLCEEDIGSVLDSHNFYRVVVARGKESRGNPGPQPAARTMMELVEKSTEHARRAIFNHLSREASEASFVSTDLGRRTRRYSASMGVAVQALPEGSVPRRWQVTPTDISHFSYLPLLSPLFFNIQ